MERPTPEELLARVHEEERKTKFGKLKIYLGAAPGVGKTYTMLQDALAQRAQGYDVLIGVVETHGRSATKDLVDYFETLPRQKVDYRGRILEEFDLDAALKRHPQLILVDEMAHTNAPGLRHTKRWQDIKELLDRGIDVYSTLNVQHVESLNDVVAQIIGTQIKETVPDSMLEIADTIEIVDLPTEDLLKRLREGKIYFPEQAKLAAENFFTKGNLIALRELALRITAERVRVQVLLHRTGEDKHKVLKTKDVLLTCVGPGNACLRVIRTAKRLANSLGVEWYAVFIETPQKNLTQDQRNSAIKNLQLAEKLGAKTQVLTGNDLVKTIMRFGHEHHVTKIIIGKQIRPRWKDFLFRSLPDEMVRHSGDMDVYIITGGKENVPTIHQALKRECSDWKVYGIACSIVFLITLISFFFAKNIGIPNILMMYLLGITAIALYGKTGPSVIASILSVLAYDFFFIPPRFSFRMTDIKYFFSLIVMLFIAQIISHLAIVTRRQSINAYLAERRTSALYRLSRQLASTRGTAALLEVALHYLSELFDSKVIALLPKNNQLSVVMSAPPHLTLTPKDQSVAQWVFEAGQNAGLGTDTLPSADALNVPLKATQGTLGVISFQPLAPHKLFTPEETNLLEACISQIALALEVDRMQEIK